MDRISSLLYIAYFNFAVQYRKTLIGPVWVLIGPTLFITTVGLLFARVSNVDESIFIPHLSVGLIMWTLVSGFVIGSSTVFRRSRAQIMQGEMTLFDIVTVDVLRTVLHFSHQVIIILIVFVFYDISVTVHSLVSIIGLLLLILNGVWLTVFFGIIGARYRDLSEVISAIMRIAFLATPIIWMPTETGRGSIMGAFLTLNPFYHFLDIIRAPLLGNPVAELSWIVVILFTIIGFLVSSLFYQRLSHRVPLWV